MSQFAQRQGSEPRQRLAELMQSSQDAELRGDLTRALDLVRRASLDPDSGAAVWWRLATLLADAGREDGLRAALEGVLDRDPAHAGAWESLVGLVADDASRAAARERVMAARGHGLSESDVQRWLRRLTPSVRPNAPERPPTQPTPGPMGSELLPSDVDILRFLSWFGGREDVYARQWWSPAKGRGGYSPVHEPITPGVMRRHFLGEHTVGVYPVRLDGTAVFMALDLDVIPTALQAAQMDKDVAARVQVALDGLTRKAHERLAAFGMGAVIESSGYKGRHLWVLFTEPVNAGILFELGRRLAAELLREDEAGFVNIESFPRQPMRRDDGLGNLIKLPLGIHRRTGRRSVFLDAALAPILRPFTWLRSVERVRPEVASLALEQLPAASGGPPPAAPVVASPDGKRVPAPEWGEPVQPGSLPRPQLPPAFTETELARSADLRLVRERCGVVGHLIEHTLAGRPLPREAWLTMKHTLGHTDDGLRAVNFLLDRAQGPAAEKLVSVLRGNPMSCQKLCGRVPEDARKRCTGCEFPWAPQHYPTPGLHLLDPRRPPEAPPAPETDHGLETLVRTFTATLTRLRSLEAECRDLLASVVRGLQTRPDKAIQLPEGTLALGDGEDGEPRVLFTRAAPDGVGAPVTQSLQVGASAVKIEKVS